MKIHEIFNGFKSLKIWERDFSAIGKDNHSHVVLLDIPLSVDAAIDDWKLPWHKYLKGQ